MSKTPVTEQRPNPKMIEDVVRLIEGAFNDLVDEEKDYTPSWQVIDKATVELIKRHKLDKLMDDIDKAEKQLNVAQERLDEAVDKLIPEGEKLRGNNTEEKMASLAAAIVREERAKQRDLRKQRRKLIARARMAKTQDALEKILSDAGIL